MRLADYLMNYLEQKNIKHIFMLSGGGMMYLMDALGHSNIEYVCCHHEQAAGIAAIAYSLKNNDLGVCMVTTGPGGTNALTAAGAAYVDSTPVLFISGQVKTADFASTRNVRQFGAQENDIIEMVAPVTKYAAQVLDKDDIKYYLDKALYMALHGRRGPVWLDIPLDIQNSDINVNNLRTFDPKEINHSDIIVNYNPQQSDIDYKINGLVDDLKLAKRPLILAGYGMKASGAEDDFRDIYKQLGIPIVTTWRELDLLDDEDALFFGSPGLQARRYSNLIIQGCDLLIVLGSRMDNMITAFDESHFAYRAKKYIVDIDINEINKLKMTDVIAINSDIRIFLAMFTNKIKDIQLGGYNDWITFCNNMKRRFPLCNEKQEKELGYVDLYKLTDKISDYCGCDDTIVVSSTSRCNTAGHIALKHKQGQSIISSMGFGSMGFALPSVVGAWFASDCNRVIMLEGDGSLQLNIQELQTIRHHNIDAKMFIFSNVGYAAIATMQDRNFDGFHVGSDANSGVTLPDLEAISEAYKIKFYKIDKDEDIDSIVDKVMSEEGPVICEFVGSILFDEIPKCISSLDKNGNRVSAALENPYPFLDKEVMEEIYSEF